MNDEKLQNIANKIMDHIVSENKEVIEAAVAQTILGVDVVLRINEDHKLEIVNPFKGCGCESDSGQHSEGEND